MVRRLTQLYIGLALYGFSSAMMVRSELGLNPWDVFHEGLGHRTPLSFGNVVILSGVVVLLLWIPLRQRPGLGTISNIVVIGLTADLGLWLLPDIDSASARAVMLTAGIFLNGAATSAYIGAGFGPGPRDGLMTGLAGRTGWSIRIVRTGIELAVLGTGWVLGGTVGIGTILYAVTIGLLVQRMLPLFTSRLATPAIAGR
jgi:uncharacterized membrane protein YczE